METIEIVDGKIQIIKTFIQVVNKTQLINLKKTLLDEIASRQEKVDIINQKLIEFEESE